MTVKGNLPPGLSELAEAEKLSDSQVEQLARAWNTIRGHRPTTLAEWQPLYHAVKKYFKER